MILLDEIEKASPDVFNILLQVLEDGHLTDSMGRKVDFKHTVLIMTSNVGARLITQKTSLGFTTSDEDITYKKMKELVMGEVKKTFNPEFLNRLDEVIVFHSLSEQHLRGIVAKEVRELTSSSRRTSSRSSWSQTRSNGSSRKRTTRGTAPGRSSDSSSGTSRMSSPSGSFVASC